MHNIIRGQEVIGKVLYCRGILNAFNEQEDPLYLEGKETGEHQGYEKAQQEIKTFVQLLQKLGERLIEERKALFTRYKPEMITFILTAAEKIIRQELGQPEKFVKLIDSLLAFATPAFQGEVVKVFLSPEDLILLEGYLSKISYDKKEIRGLRFFPDPSLSRGDCRLETKVNLLNYTLNRELEDLKMKILQ